MKSLLKNSAILMFGELFTKVLSVLYLIPLIRINENIGVLNATVTIPFGLFVVLGTLGINIILTSEIPKYIKETKRLANTLVTGVSFILVLSTLAALILFIFAPAIVNSMISDKSFYSDIVLATKILSVGVILYGITAYMRTVITAFGNFHLVSFSYISEQIIKVLLIIVPTLVLVGQRGMNVGIYAQILAVAIVLAMVTTLLLYLWGFKQLNIFPHYRNGNVKLTKRTISTLVFGGIVVLAASIYASAYEMIDFVMMENYLINHVSQAENDLIRGIYFTSSWKIIFIPISISGGIITVMMTKMKTKTEDNAHHFNLMLDLSLLFGLISMVGVLGLGEYVYQFLYGSSSQGIIIVQAILIPCYIARNILGTYVVSAEGNKTSILTSLGIMLITKIGFNLVFMNIFGYIGVVISSTLSIIISFIYLYFKNSKLFIINQKVVKLKIAMITVTIIIGLILYVCNTYIFDQTLINFLIMGAITLGLITLGYLPIIYKLIKK